MESRFRKLLSLRRSSTSASVNSSDELSLHSVAYEQLPRSSKPPIFISQALRKSMTARRAKDDLDGLAIKAFSYSSMAPSHPPQMGGKPLPGNGPVKLQTSRRLSSGELLVTKQDYQRTLEDIREGEYIVGRKERRVSHASATKGPRSIRTSTPTSPRVPSGSPIPPRPGSPQLSVADIRAAPHPPSSLASPPMVPDTADIDHRPTDNPATDNTPIENLPVETLPSEHSASDETHQDDLTTHAPNGSLPDLAAPFPNIPRAHATRDSLLSQREEQNATIQALWKAEYSRLVAIYGQDGVDRNIAALNRDRMSLLPDPFETQTNPGQSSGIPQMALDPLPRPSVDVGPPSGSPRQSVHSADDNSDFSNQNRLSFVSSHKSSSSYTQRTSIFESDIPTTKEDVRKMVESMRVNYLEAIEVQSKQMEKEKERIHKQKRKKTVRASYSAGQGSNLSPPAKPQKAMRQSWHPTSTVPTKDLILSRRPKSKPKEMPDILLESIKTSPSKSSLKSKSSIQRADSLTLGSLLAPATTFIRSKTKAAEPPPPPQQPDETQAAYPTIPTGPQSKMDHTRLIDGNESPRRAAIEPEIDDFDIFYQDLLAPLPAPLIQAAPRAGRGLDSSQLLDSMDAAPPPPAIPTSSYRRTVDPI